MGATDSAVLWATAIATLAFAIVLWRRGVRGRYLVAAVWIAFYGCALVVMMSAHNIEIVYNTVTHQRSFAGTPFVYDWRVYSLLLFGVLLTVLGARVLHMVSQVRRDHVPRRRPMLRAIGWVLALVVPTIPIQATFGYLLSALSLITGAVVLATSMSDRSV